MKLPKFLCRILRINGYNPDDDPDIQERHRITTRTETTIRVFSEHRHPMTGMTLADMAANRKNPESWR